MNISSTKVLTAAVFTLTLCIGLHLNTYKVKADTQTATQGIVLKSASLVTNKTVKVPAKETPVAKSSNKSSSSQSNGSSSRGFSGGTAVASGSANNVVSKAFQFLGRPYVYGASGPSAFDCSGFTAYVYGALGVSLPHYTVSQSQMGQGVSRDSLQPGDLIFFNTAGFISHVGIYIGGGQFIHASSGSHQVTVSELASDYYASRFVCARRLLR